MNEKNGSVKPSFKDTLNLPRTDFPIRANQKEDDAMLLLRWQHDDLYIKSFFQNAENGNDPFILHDGPPYANGNIHMGTAYNKILKDVVSKSRRMLGQQVPIVPGWDCHGLPIEQKVLQASPELAIKGKNEIKKACRTYAKHWIEVQKNEFKSLGVLMDWDRPYLTMDASYESTTLHAFGSLVEASYIERKNKTVPWCIHCQTVLASAEIEYAERKDNSVYALFPIVDNNALLSLLGNSDKKRFVAIWTTQPWTIPLNRAILMKPDTDYVLVVFQNKEIIIGKALLGSLEVLLQTSLPIIKEVSSTNLAAISLRVHHPLNNDFTVPVIVDDSVSITDGTAFVHCAPGSGPDDYEVAIKNELEIFSPISSNGHYTNTIMPSALIGMNINDGQIWVIKQLAQNGLLLFKGSLRHSYPHCWRCRNGLIFRATKQWFCNLAVNDLKNSTLKIIENTVKTVPAASMNRLRTTIEGRLEWCVSRQRAWGVPITGLICDACDATYVSKALIDSVAAGVAQEGIEYWDTVSLSALSDVPAACFNCHKYAWRKETDILDVWFDSGISHCAVLQKNPHLRFPADVYMEGKDQHRGWFQSSLLTSVALDYKSCSKVFVTLGYIVDAQGRKMSKSLGNGVEPQEMINRMGTDGLRLWAVSNDFHNDVIISEVLINNVQEVFRKIRNTCRFLLSNIYDFNPTIDMVPLNELMLIDQYALQQLFQLNQSILFNYVSYDITAVYHKLGDYCVSDLSAFYLDIVKDRLYVESPKSYKRRSAQTACFIILDTITRLMAPILSFTAELVSDNYQNPKSESIHLQLFNNLSTIWYSLVRPIVDETYIKKLDTIFANPVSASLNLAHIERLQYIREYNESWGLVKRIRSTLLKALEEKRAQGIIKHSLEAKLLLYINYRESSLLPLIDLFKLTTHDGNELLRNFIRDCVIVSQCNFVNNADALTSTAVPGFYVGVMTAEGTKCPRCWQWDISNDSDGLCTRCVSIVRDK